jgi:glycosyltransferase involved in cell wall biosynthesis
MSRQARTTEQHGGFGTPTDTRSGAAPPASFKIVHTESSCGWGGQELRILAESQGLLRRGHDVRILCPPTAPIFEAAQRRGVPVEALPIARKNLRAVWAVWRWLVTHHVDIVNTHSSTDSWLCSVASRLCRSRPRIVRTRHISGHVSRNRLTHWLYARGADQVVTCGERLRQSLIENNGLASQHVISVPTGVDTARFVPGPTAAARQRLQLPTDGILIGIVAVLRRGKGHQYLLEALQRIPRADVRAVIVGDGPMREDIARRIQEWNLADRVRMVGQQEDVVPWLQALDIFVLPSWSTEGVPQSVMQAMSCQLPVVSTRYGSIDEAVVHNETGLLVPPKDASALAAALQQLIADDALRQRFAAAGRQRALARFDVDRMLDRMESVFQQVVVSKAA